MHQVIEPFTSGCIFDSSEPENLSATCVPTALSSTRLLQPCCTTNLPSTDAVHPQDPPHSEISSCRRKLYQSEAGTLCTPGTICIGTQAIRPCDCRCSVTDIGRNTRGAYLDVSKSRPLARPVDGVSLYRQTTGPVVVYATAHARSTSERATLYTCVSAPARNCSVRPLDKNVLLESRRSHTDNGHCKTITKANEPKKTLDNLFARLPHAVRSRCRG